MTPGPENAEGAAKCPHCQKPSRRFYGHPQSSPDRYCPECAKVWSIAPTPGDGWIEWKGGEQPVGNESVVDIRFRSGNNGQAKAGMIDWEHGGYEFDILRYRLAAQPAGEVGTPSEAEQAQACLLALKHHFLLNIHEKAKAVRRVQGHRCDATEILNAIIAFTDSERMAEVEAQGAKWIKRNHEQRTALETDLQAAQKERDEARARIAGLEAALRSAFPILEDECDGNCAAVGGRCCNCGCEQKKYETVEKLKTLLTNPSLPHTVPSQ
jgi:hypothetical protein